MTELLQRVVSAPSPEREAEITALGPWFHNLHLLDGARTAPAHPLGDFPAFKWQELAAYLPQDLSGWRALDIGCNAGFYSFELARRGAQVTAIDTEPLFLRQAKWAAREFALSDRIEFRQMQVYELARLNTSYDLVLFLGVFYHLRYPMLGLDIVADTVARLLAFQTMTMPGELTLERTRDLDLSHRGVLRHPGWPAMAFIEHALASDVTNWWVPNHAAVEAMLRASGLRVIARPGHEMYLCEPSGDTTIWPRGRGAMELRAATGRSWHGSRRGVGEAQTHS